jgi:hypothetical protein
MLFTGLSATRASQLTCDMYADQVMGGKARICR